MGMMTWMLVGSLIGLMMSLSQKAHPENGLLGAVLLGILGALVGGLLADLFLSGQIINSNLMSISVAVLGSLSLLLMGRLFKEI